MQNIDHQIMIIILNGNVPGPFTTVVRGSVERIVGSGATLRPYAPIFYGRMHMQTGASLTIGANDRPCPRLEDNCQALCVWSDN